MNAIAELLAWSIVAAMFWPSLTPHYWREFPDKLAPAIALALELAAIAGMLKALSRGFT